MRFTDLADNSAHGPMPHVVVDSRLGARLLAGATPDEAAVVLHELGAAGLLTRSHGRSAAVWRLAPVMPGGTAKEKRDRIDDLLDAIAASPKRRLRSIEIGEQLGLASPSSHNRWIRRAEKDALIRATEASTFDPRQSYELTPTGRGRQQRTR